MDKEPLINRVAQSGIITLNLEDFLPEEPIVEFDLKDHLFHGLILKEKDFRTALKEHDWQQYVGKVLAVFCSADAIIPVWAYMLVTAYAQPHALDVFQGNPEQYLQFTFSKIIEKLDGTAFEEKRVVIKGCGDKPVPPSAYAEITKKLRPVAKSIMYGEPCSTVPIFKKPREVKRLYQK